MCYMIVLFIPTPCKLKTPVMFSNKERGAEVPLSNEHSLREIAYVSELGLSSDLLTKSVGPRASG